MTTPFQLLHDTATVQTASQSVDATGAPTASNSGSSTVACRIDPDNSSDALRYMRETGKRLSTGFFPPTYTDGTALVLAKGVKLTVSSVPYRVVGPAMNAGDVEVLQVVSLEEDT